MAQSQLVTNEGIGELNKLWHGTAATKMSKIVCLEKATTCTAAVGSTFAAPADTSPHHTDSGLVIAAIATAALGTTNAVGDTFLFDHVFTASATKNVNGIHTCNEDGDVTFVECCFNAVVAVENTDTITIDGEVVVDQA